MKEKIKKVISGVVTTLLVISAVLCFTVVTKSFLGDDPSILGFRTFYVLTGSMEPTIHENAIVIVKKSNTYDVGDIITFESDDPAIQLQTNTHANTHRIVGIDGGKYITRGDANEINDEYAVGPEKIYGKVIFNTGKAEWIGNFLGFATTPTGFFFVILIPVIIICILLLKDFIKVYRGELLKIKEQTGNPAEKGEDKKDKSSGDDL